ncbi:MAG: DUF6144 family protein [Thermodesulfobacteriota bacterium]
MEEKIPPDTTEKTRIRVRELLKNMEAHGDSTTIKTILEACGARCPFTHLPDEQLLTIKAEATDPNDFLEMLCQKWRLKKENDQYYVVFDKCYCPLVLDDTEEFSGTLCHCTLGNIKHKLRIGLGREIEVEMQKTILGGDDECRFHLKIEAD